MLLFRSHRQHQHASGQYPKHFERFFLPQIGCGEPLSSLFALPLVIDGHQVEVIHPYSKNDVSEIWTLLFFGYVPHRLHNPCARRLCRPLQTLARPPGLQQVDQGFSASVSLWGFDRENGDNNILVNSQNQNSRTQHTRTLPSLPSTVKAFNNSKLPISLCSTPKSNISKKIWSVGYLLPSLYAGEWLSDHREAHRSTHPTARQPSPRLVHRSTRTPARAEQTSNLMKIAPHVGGKRQVYHLCDNARCQPCF